MLWIGIGLALLVIAGWIIYSRRKGTVTLTKDQAEMVLELVRKDLTETEKKKQAIIDESAAKGNTISLEKFSYDGNNPDVEEAFERIKKELFERYGARIPVDVAYRLVKQFDPDEESPWSDNPGCFERHLQRREGNLLFPPERRIVTQKEIDEAKERDRIEQQRFAEKVRTISSKLREQESIPLSQITSTLNEIQELIEEGTSLGCDIGHLEKAEEKLMQSANEALPDCADLLKKAGNLSALNRIPYFTQSLRKDSPILKEEEIPALLSEDLKTISLAGYMSRSYAPNYRPNEADIMSHLDKAVNNGFSKERAAQIISAWNET